jgi:hypothetical protein
LKFLSFFGTNSKNLLLLLQAFASHMTTETQKQLELHRMQQEQLKRQQEHIMQQQHKIQELQVRDWTEARLSI